MHTLIIAARVFVSMGSTLICLLSTNYNPGGFAHTWGEHYGNFAGMLTHGVNIIVVSLWIIMVRTRIINVSMTHTHRVGALIFVVCKFINMVLTAVIIVGLI